MTPTLAIVGRPNVGKSTLFNCFTKTRDALVADIPGLTRDRQYGAGRLGDRPYIVVDTGGLLGEEEVISGLMAEQANQAMQEADAILFLVDARAGVTPLDATLANRLRQLQKPVYLVANKVDGINSEVAKSDFYSLGLGEPYTIAASHGRGVMSLITHVLEHFPQSEEAIAEQTQGTRVAIVGRPNVGKSTLVNRMLGDERVVVFDLPGTTRDSIFIPLERHGTHYTIIDTAGVRRRSRVDAGVEKFSVIKTLQAIEAANVVILVVDGREGIVDQDLSLLGFIIETGKALVFAVNKWDGMDSEAKLAVKRQLERRLVFVNFARVHFISALHGSGVGDLFGSVNEAYESATRKLATPKITRILEMAVSEHQPPLVQGHRIKLRYAHAGGQNPPCIVVHGNQTESLPASYKRYLEHYFRDKLKLIGTPIRFEFKSSENPYKGKRNILTPRQIQKRKRMMRHVK